MNLNESLLSGATDTPIIDGDVVKTSGSETSGLKDVTVLTGSDVVPTTGAVVPEADLEKLPGMDVSLKIVEDGQVKVTTLKDVESGIIGQESINRATVEHLATAFESLLDGPVTISEFTTAPSRTNFDFIKRQMSKGIAKEEQALIGNFELLLGQPTEHAKALYQQVLVSYIPALESQLYGLRSLGHDKAECILNTKNSVFPFGEAEFVDLATVDVSTLDVSKVNSDSLKGQGILSCIEAAGMLLKDPSVAQFVHSVIEGAPQASSISKENRPVYMGRPTCGKDLLDFYTKDVIEYVRYIETVCEEQFKILNTVSEEVRTNMGVSIPEDNVTLSKAMPVIQTSFAVLERSMRLIHRLSLLNYNSKVFLTFLSSL